MLRLTEVASQSETFPKRALQKLVKQLIEWMAQAATTAQSFLLTGRLYWLFGAAALLLLQRTSSYPRNY
jgi:hypothetical protein